jgi:hypothetical protein
MWKHIYLASRNVFQFVSFTGCQLVVDFNGDSKHRAESKGGDNDNELHDNKNCVVNQRTSLRLKGDSAMVA